MPLVFSPLPFNIDGFPLVRNAQSIGAAGTWTINPEDVSIYDIKMPAYSLIWNALSGIAGVGVLSGLQLLMPFLLTAVVLPAYLLTVKATRSRAAGYAAGLFAATFGSFLFLTSAAMKESVALLILPMVVVLFSERSDPRKRCLAFFLLLVLPLFHHLTTLLALGMVSALVVLGQRRALAVRRFTWSGLALDLVSGPILAVPAYAYYAEVRMTFLDAVTALDALVLFLSVVVLLAAALVRMHRPSPVRLGRRRVSPASRVLVVPALVVAVLAVNARTSLFAGVLPTQGSLFLILPAVLAFVAFAFVGFQLLRRTTNLSNDLVLAMLVAPTALVLFAFLRGLDPLSLILVYRTFDFIDYALAILVGIGFAVAWYRLRGPGPRLTLGAAFVGLLLVTTPMAFDSQAVFGVDNVTRPAEFQALALLTALHARNVTTDQRLAYVGSLWFDLHTDASLPFLLRDNESLAGYGYALVLERWSTVGAQEHPAPNVVVPYSAIQVIVASNRVVYAAGPPGDRLFVIKIGSG